MIKVYLSHSIRGKFGADATDEQMKINCDKAIAFTSLLRKKFPELDIYCPAEHDLFIVIAYRKKYLSEKQILDVDCEIVKNCDVLFVYCPDGYLSRGMMIEIQYAQKNDIPVLILTDFMCLENKPLIKRFLKRKLR